MPKRVVNVLIEDETLAAVDAQIGRASRSEWIREATAVWLWLNRRWPDCWTASRAIERLDEALNAK
ncbi:MAG: hypothetical protein FJW34_25375 [Acidobacteria bacterium]|nr:hypothetical protein [Acidobacteriota bacterium]